MDNPSSKPVTKIGILLVHGVGEQQPGEYVDSFAKVLETAATAEITGASLTKHVVNRNPGTIRLGIDPNSNGSKTHIYLHGCDWADLDDPVTLKNRLRFWWWGFSMWNRRGFMTPKLAGTKKMSVRDPGPLAKVRAQLFLAGTVFCAVALVFRIVPQVVFSIPVIGRALQTRSKLIFNKLLGNSPLEALVAYVGDVKLYQDEDRRDAPFERRGEKPRWSIRRRMVRRMIEVAEADYDRWYVAAHSLGTVLAFNGLMETAEALPNYLDRSTVERLRQRQWIDDGTPSQRSAMEPPGPPYVHDRDTLQKDKVFEGLAGFLTFGSPIDKFSTLWPVIVPVDGTPNVFPESFQWVNIYDDLDPVSGSLDQVDVTGMRKNGGTGRLPTNYGYRNESTLATAHTNYFAKPGGQDSLARAFLRWIVGLDMTFEAPLKNRIADDQTGQPFQSRLLIQVLIIFALLSALLGWTAIEAWNKYIWVLTGTLWSQIGIAATAVGFFCAVLVLIVGRLNRVICNN